MIMAVVFAVLIWLPMALAGLPLDTPDGFMHLGWSVGWVRQLQSGWFWPTWNDLPWAGAGSFSYLIYPPLFRVLSGLPMLFGVPPDHSIISALLVVFLVNATGAVVLAKVWLLPGFWRFFLVFWAVLNPYLWVNVYVRGAWPEALAQALLWWLVLGLVGLEKKRRWGIAVSVVTLSAIILSNWNTALLTALVWTLAGLGLLGCRGGQWKGWLVSTFLALVVTSPFWLIALLSLHGVRQPLPADLFKTEFFFGGGGGPRTFADLLWIQSFCITSLLAFRFCGWGLYPQRNVQFSGFLQVWALTVSILGLMMMFPPANILYQVFTPLQRIQFPWRWLSVTWIGCLLWASSPGLLRSQGSNSFYPLRRVWLVGMLALASVALWADSLSRFSANWIGHSPSPQDKIALRILLACPPLEPCQSGVIALPKTGELRKRFVPLADGRIALSGVPDYGSVGNPDCSWNQRMVLFWVPDWPQVKWAEFHGSGFVVARKILPTHRLFHVKARGSGILRIMQWAHPNWSVQWRPANPFGLGFGVWSKPLEYGGGNAQGWIEVPLSKGNWQVQLNYQLRFFDRPRLWGWCSKSLQN